MEENENKNEFIENENLKNEESDENSLQNIETSNPEKENQPEEPISELSQVKKEEKLPEELEPEPLQIKEEENLTPEKNKTLVTVRPVKFRQFEPVPPVRTIKKNLDILQDISMHVSVELGRTKSSIKEVMDLEIGSIVELEKIAGEQVEIFVNDKFVAKGEVIVIEDKFGVRVTSTNLPKVD